MTPAEHLRSCDPVSCLHIRFCRECLERYGVCKQHRYDPDSGIFWADGQEPREEP